VIGAIVSLASTSLGGVLYSAQASKYRSKLEWLGSDFAIGAMLAASLFSLIGVPMFSHLQKGESSFAQLILFGSVIGFAFSGLLKRTLPFFSSFSAQQLSQFLFVGVLAFHNLPEGMASGVADFGGETGLLSVIALQNVPEGFLFAAMLVALGVNSQLALLGAILSGAIEAAGALSASAIVAHDPAWLPFLKGFAGGAMLYVTAAELGSKIFRTNQISFAAKPFFAGVGATLALQVLS
jgi:zinc transporter, ZIP family